MRSISIIFTFIFFRSLLSALDQSIPSPYYFRYLEVSHAIEEYNKSLNTDIDPVYALYLLNESKSNCNKARELDIQLQMMEGESESTLIEVSDLTLLSDRIHQQTNLIQLGVRESLIKNKRAVNQPLFQEYWLEVILENPSVVALMNIIKKIQSIEISKKKPQDSLEEALFTAQYALHLNILTQEGKDGLPMDLLVDYQKQVMESAENFVTALLVWEKDRFKTFHCEKQPWRRVIPLLQKGFDHAQAANIQLNQGKISEAIINQDRTVFYWKQSLEALEQNSDNEDMNDSTVELDRTLKQLQEMILEDAQKKEQPNQELQSW